jgi:lambda family phage tail tape measure protein
MAAIDRLTVDFDANTAPLEAKLLQLAGQANAFSGSITRAFKDAVIGGKDFESVLSSLALKIAGLALDRALQPLSNIFGGLIDGLFKGFGLANGGVVAGGQVKPFARGGVVSAPTLFPLARGLGLMGEAGAEAVLPLARGGDGTLGVRTSATPPTVVNFNITTTDADSFRKSEAQVTAMLARAVGRGRRGL